MKRIKIAILIMIIPFLSRCLGQGELKRIYLSDYDVRLNGDQKCQRFIQTHSVKKEALRYLYSPLELIFKDNKLLQAFEWSEGVRFKRDLEDDEIGMHYFEADPHEIYQISRTSKSQSYLGGDVPNSFTIPEFDFIAPFQYLGMISKNDNAFSWLPFDLHLTAPLYLNFEPIFIDYSEPCKPVVVNIDKLKMTRTSFPNELRIDSKIIFEKTFIAATRSNHYDLEFAHSGIPHWIQVPNIPVCPKTNKTMRFLMQISSNSGIKTSEHNITSENEHMLKYFEKLNFWGDGYLYIFIQPESNVVCYLIQNT